MRVKFSHHLKGVEDTMAKGRDSQKSDKKAPALTAKEKKQRKKEKKASK